jgi:hypothetical protein
LTETETDVLEGTKATLRDIILKAEAQLKAIEEFERQGIFRKNEAELESQLEALPWIEAASKKCDFVRDAPADLIDQVRAAKGGIKGKDHHFTASSSEPTLFRFKRGSK